MIHELTLILTRSTTKIIAIALLAGILILPGMGFAVDYYISPDGDDANPGTIDAPWGTLAYALVQLDGGDTLKLMDGVHKIDHETWMSRNGRADAWITIEPAEGANPIIEGLMDPYANSKICPFGYTRIHDISFNKTGSAFLILKGGQSHMRVENCTFHNYRDAVYSDPYTHDVIIRNNDFYFDNPISCDGVRLASIDSVVEHNRFHFTAANQAERTYRGVRTWWTAENIEIRYNTFIGEPGTYVPGECVWVGGLHTYESHPGNDGNWESTNVNVHDNIMINCPIGAISFKHAKDSSFHNNTYYSPTYDGIVAGVYGVIHNSRDGSISNLDPALYHDPKNITIKNNIFVSGIPASYGAALSVFPNCDEGFVCDNNIWYSPDGDSAIVYWLDDAVRPFSEYQSLSGQDANSLFLNPSFIAPADNNFQLQSGSPAIDAGTENITDTISASPADFAGNPRPYQGTAVDIGAYEYTGASTLPGDIDGDGDVDLQDLLIVAKGYGVTYDLQDLLLVAMHYGEKI